MSGERRGGGKGKEPRLLCPRRKALARFWYWPLGAKDVLKERGGSEGEKSTQSEKRAGKGNPLPQTMEGLFLMDLKDGEEKQNGR